MELTQEYALVPCLDDTLRENDVITLSLPPLLEKDLLFSKKKNLLQDRNLGFVFQILVHGYSSQDLLQIVNDMIRVARILHLDETELYFIEGDFVGPFSSWNELESLNLVLSAINAQHLSDKGKLKVLEDLHDVVMDFIQSFAAKNITEKQIIVEKKLDDEKMLLHWARSNGVQTKLEIAYFEEAGRGAIAIEDLNIGDTAIEIPTSLIISEELIYKSDMFEVLKNMNGISTETMLLLWSMKERHNRKSKYRIYFETLPRDFNTGLSFGLDALSLLEGTLLLEEILQAKEYLRKQYFELCPALLSCYPDIFPPDIYSWEHFLWACELWYSNSMRIIFPNGKLQTCLVPIASLLNHSLCPHIMHYGKVDSETNTLKFCLSRPCKKGDQCYLNYGRFSSSHLVTFYGFLPKGDNPYDTIPIDIDIPEVEDAGNEADAEWTSHMVRGTWLSENKGITTHGLPYPLLGYLRGILCENYEESLSNCLESMDITKENEKTVFETLLSIFNPMLEGLGTFDEGRECASWDVRLALNFKDLQRRIVSSVVNSCSDGLRVLNQSLVCQQNP